MEDTLFFLPFGQIEKYCSASVTVLYALQGLQRLEQAMRNRRSRAHRGLANFVTGL